VAAEPFLYRKLVKRWKNLRLFPAVRIPTSAIKAQTGTGHKAQIRFVARENDALHSLGIVLGSTTLSRNLGNVHRPEVVAYTIQVSARVSAYLASSAF
jgi:hypothetical protein